MIIRFSVKNFYSIKEPVVLDLEATRSKELEKYYVIKPQKNLRLLKLALMYGPNASGKTNILFAIDFLRSLVVEPIENKTERLNFKPFLLSEQTVHSPTEFHLEFIHKGIIYDYLVRLNTQAIIYERLRAKAQRPYMVFERKTDLDRRLSHITVGSKFKLNRAQLSILEANTIWNITTLAAFQKTNIDLPDMENAFQWFNTVLFKMLTPHSNWQQFVEVLIFSLLEQNKLPKDFLIEFLQSADLNIADIIVKRQQTSDLNELVGTLISKVSTAADRRMLSSIIELLTDNIDVKPEQLRTYFVHKLGDRGYYIDYQDESAGTRKYFLLGSMFLLAQQQPRVYIIDELEASLHPEMLMHFLTTLAKTNYNIQVIASTHYRELLMERDLLRKDIIWFTQKRKDQSTELYSLADFESSKLRKANSIYNFYKSGRLGAIPKTRDFIYYN